MTRPTLRQRLAIRQLDASRHTCHECPKHPGVLLFPGEQCYECLAEKTPEDNGGICSGCEASAHLVKGYCIACAAELFDGLDQER